MSELSRAGGRGQVLAIAVVAAAALGLAAMALLGGSDPGAPPTAGARAARPDPIHNRL